MGKGTIQLTEPLYDYMLGVSLREPEILARLRAETDGMAKAQMQISPDQGQFMAWLVEALGVRQAIEIGTFTGYSALAVALALPADGTLIACDVNEEWTAVGRRYWTEAGVSDKIDLRIAPALRTLDSLVAEGRAGTFDLAFIDGHKPEYMDYYEKVLALLRTGGVVLVDNVLWRGRMLNERRRDDEDTRAIMTFNERLHGDQRVSLTMIPIGDGLTLARKR